MNSTTSRLAPTANNTGFVALADFWWGSDVGIEGA
jgi:hypothetical protein